MNEVVFGWPPKELSPNSRVHWAKKSKIVKQYRQACWALAMEAKLVIPADEKIKIHITFYPPDRRHRDYDNMISSVKAAIDGLADALKVNDKRFLPSFTFTDEVKGMVKIKVG